MRVLAVAATLVCLLLAGCSHATAPSSVRLPVHGFATAPAGDGRGTVVQWDVDPATGAAPETWVTYGPPGNPTLYSTPHQFGLGHHALRLDDIPPGWVFSLMASQGGAPEVAASTAQGDPATGAGTGTGSGSGTGPSGGSDGSSGGSADPSAGPSNAPQPPGAGGTQGGGDGTGSDGTGRTGSGPSSGSSTGLTAADCPLASTPTPSATPTKSGAPSVTGAFVGKDGTVFPGDITFNVDGEAAGLSVWTEYGPTPSFGSSTTPRGVAPGLRSVAPSLLPDTLYFLRLHASNGHGNATSACFSGRTPQQVTIDIFSSGGKAELLPANFTVRSDAPVSFRVVNDDTAVHGVRFLSGTSVVHDLGDFAASGRADWLAPVSFAPGSYTLSCPHDANVSGTLDADPSA